MSESFPYRLEWGNEELLNLKKPPTKAQVEDDEQIELRVGFGASQGQPEGTKHRHEFGSIPCLVPYHKCGDNSREFLVVFCSCGVTQEIVVVDRNKTV